MNPKELADTTDNYESELSSIIQDMSMNEYKMADIVNKLSVLMSKPDLSELLDNLTIDHASMTSALIMRYAREYNRLCSMGIPLRVIRRAPLSRWHNVISVVNGENADEIAYILHDSNFAKSLKKIRSEYYGK